jgi:hypothetical protein
MNDQDPFRPFMAWYLFSQAPPRLWFRMVNSRKSTTAVCDHPGITVPQQTSHAENVARSILLRYDRNLIPIDLKKIKSVDTWTHSIEY